MHIYNFFFFQNKVSSTIAICHYFNSSIKPPILDNEHIQRILPIHKYDTFEGRQRKTKPQIKWQKRTKQQIITLFCSCDADLYRITII